MKLNRKWIMVIALVMSMAMATGGTLAFLTDRENATNTFTVGKVDIVLEEGEWNAGDDHTLLPGASFAKAPKIINNGNTDAWVWMEITLPTGMMKYIDWNTTDWKMSSTASNGKTTVTLKRTALLPDGEDTAEAFTKVEISEDVTNVSDLGDGVIDVIAYAIQGDAAATIDAAITAYSNNGGAGGEGGEPSTPSKTTAWVSTAQELTDALAAGSDVRLTDNIDMGSTKLTVANDVTIDLNGKILSGAGVDDANEDHLMMVNNGATLNIKDSSTNENGKITYAQGNGQKYGYTIDLEGQLNLYSGTIELTGDSWDIGYAVDVRPNAWGTNYTEDTVFRMYGGKIVSSYDALRVASSSSETYPNIVASFIMEDGEISAARDGLFIQQSDANYDTLKVEIKGGEITSERYPIRFYGPNATNVNSGAEKPMTLTIAKKATLVSNEKYGDVTPSWYTPNVVAFGGEMTKENLEQYSTITIEK